MTVATTATTEFNVDELITIAYRLNGFGPQPPTNNDLQLGRQILQLGLQALSNTGIKLRTRELVTLTLTPGVSYVDPASDTLSIEKGGVIRNLDGVTDIPIELIPMSRYQELPDKTTSGMPTYYWAEQQPGGTWRIRFYPVTTADWPTFIVPRTRRARDVDTGNVTVDFDPKWHLTIVNFIQAKLALSKGRRDLGTQLMTEYDTERQRAEDNESEKGDGMFVAYSTPWEDR